MGACDFSTYQKGGDAKKAFAAAVDEARFEHGHGGYSGTIAEKGGDGFKIVTREPVPQEVAYRMAAAELGLTGDGRDEQWEKWGPCGAIPVCPEGSYTIKTRKVTLRLEGDEARGDDHGYLREAFLMERVKGKITLKDSQRLFGVKIVDDEKRMAVEASRTEGKTMRVYYLSPGVGFGVGATARRYQKDYESQSAAFKAAKELAREAGGEWHVNARVVREDGSPLAVVKAKPAKRKVVVEAQIAERRHGSRSIPPTEGWLFFGIASM